jgi:hemoglobin/transferrin/lactoferrin receptor protein
VVENSAWQEYSGHAKVEYRPIKDHEFTFVGQHFHQSDVPRTEQTVFAKAFEGTSKGANFVQDTTHDRYLTYMSYTGRNIEGPVQEAQVTLSYQFSEEEMVRLRPDAGRWGPRLDDPNGFQCDTYGAQAQFRSKVGPLGVLTYGGDYYRDEVSSARRDYRWARTGPGDPPTAPDLQRHVQGSVADDSSFEQAGLFVQDQVDLFDRKVTLTASGRFEYAQIEAREVESPANGSEFSIAEQWTSAVGAFRFLVRPDLESGDHWHVFGGVSQAFRAPSLNDFTAFDISSFVFEQPAKGLQPETFVTLEAGTKAKYERFDLGLTYYVTFADGLLDRVPTGAVDSSNRAIVEKMNAGDGYVNGIEAEGRWRFLKNFALWGNLTWTEGESDQMVGDATGNPPSLRQRKPWSRLIPVMSHMGLRYEPAGERWWVECHADVYSDADRLAYANQFDTRRIPPGGTSGFGVVGIRGGAKLLKEKLTIVGGIENLANEDYRIHGSGQNMPGTNFTLSLSYKW